jgi:uncharacterized membrane protein
VTERSLRRAVALLALGGAALSVYLVWTRWSSAELLCSTGGCETVQSSSYAELLGVPVALLGLAAYLLIAATALLRTVEAAVAGAALAFSAVAFSAYLLVVQLVVIDAVCQWCVANDVIVSLVAAAALLRLYPSSSPSASA